MTCVAFKIDDPSEFSVQADPADPGPAPAAQPASESLFVSFVEEIDAWARQALASNGFGDY